MPKTKDVGPDRKITLAEMKKLDREAYQNLMDLMAESVDDGGLDGEEEFWVKGGRIYNQHSDYGGSCLVYWDGKEWTEADYEDSDYLPEGT